MIIEPKNSDGLYVCKFKGRTTTGETRGRAMIKMAMYVRNTNPIKKGNKK